MDRLSTQASWADNLKAVLTKKAEQQAKGERDNFCPNSYSGSNFDDCYEIGTLDGEIYYARELLGLYF